MVIAVYGTVSGTIRRIIKDPKTPSIHAGPGESIFVCDEQLPASLDSVRQQLNVFLGRDATPKPCAVIDSNGNVVDVIMADELLDAIPGYTLKNSTYARINDSYSDGLFVSPPSTIELPAR